MADNPQKRDLFAELSEMSVREVESQLPGTAERGTEETEESVQKAWRNTIRTISQRKSARTKEREDSSGRLPDALPTETEEKENTVKPKTDALKDSANSGSALADILDESVFDADSLEASIDAGSDCMEISDDITAEDETAEDSTEAESGQPDSSPEVRTETGSGRSGISALEQELLGATGKHVEKEESTVSSINLERELLSVRADSSAGAGKNVQPDLSKIGLEFEKNSEQSSSARKTGTDGEAVSDENMFYADIAEDAAKKREPVNEPLKGERYDPMEEELLRREKKDRIIRIVLFSALMLVVGALLTYVTFIRDSGKKKSVSSKTAVSANSGKSTGGASDSAGSESGGTLSEEASGEIVDDISMEDLSVYLSEMPAEGTQIVSTDDALYSYEQMVKDLYFLTTRYPDIISMNILASTLDQRAVYEALIGNPEGSMHVVVQYGMRGDEYITTLLAMRQLEYYCEERSAGNVYRNHNYKEIFEDVCIHILPMVNPDGVTLSQFGIDSMRTKAAKESVKACYKYDKAAGLTDKSLEEYLLTFGANASGVDISKNFPAGWSRYTGGAVQPSFEGYKGPSSGSEPETQAVLNAVNDKTKAVVIYRATGNVIYWDYGSEGTVHEEGQHLAESLATRSGYSLTALPKYDSKDAGGCADYYNENGIPAVSMVVGEGTSPVDISAFPDIWTANLNILPMLANLYTNG